MTNQWKKLLSSKRLCLNCTNGKHRAADCRSRSTCGKCGKKHHTSTYDSDRGAQLLTAACLANNAVVYPVFVVEVEGVRCRALLDTGAGSSYTSATLLNRIGVRPGRHQV